MPLNKPQLQNGIQQAFQKMQDTPVPENADEAQLKQHFTQLLITLAQDLANTIDAYIHTGEITNIQTSGSVSLTGNPQTITINTNQTNIGKIQ
jgi:hypothetical protein